MVAHFGFIRRARQAMFPMRENYRMRPMAQLNIIPARGERAFICGQTGSGKTQFAVWLLRHMPGTIIYDTKEEKKFSTLPNSVRVTTIEAANEAIRDKHKNYDYVILRPPVEMTVDPDALDNLLAYHYQHMRGVGAYIDELFMFHNGGRVGPGLMSLLTRGRGRGITLTMSAQRPAWLSRFCLTESQRFYIFRLVDRADRKRLTEIIPDLSPDEQPAKFHFQYFDFDIDAPLYFSPVLLDNNQDFNYVDDSDDSQTWI